MADTRTLTVSLKAETASLKKGLADARNQFSLLQKSSQSTANVLKTAFSVMAGGFIFNKMEQGIRSTISAFSETATMIEDTKHLSEVLGSTTEEIQVLQRAAGLAEVDMDMLGRNIKIMTKNLGAASMGTGPAKDALDRIGLSAQSLIKMSLSDQLDAIASKINMLGTTSQKASIAASIFGKSGMDMLPFLAAAGESLSELNMEMQSTGELFSNFEAAAVDEMGDSMAMLRGVFQAFKNQLVIQLAPAVQYITELMRNFAASFGGARPFMTMAIDAAVEGIRKMLNFATMTYAKFLAIKGVILQVASYAAKAFSVLGSVFKGLISGDLTQLMNMFSLIGNTFKYALLEALDALARGLDSVLGKMGMSTGVSEFTSQLAAGAKAQMAMSGASLMMGVGGTEFADSLAQSAQDAFQQTLDVVGGEWLGETFKSKWQEIMSGGGGFNGTDIKKAMGMESFDILPPLKKEKALREGIADTMKETADYAKDIKDFGEGTSYRTGEYSPRVGGVTGGVGGIGATNPVGMSAAGATASSRGNASTGADGSIPLLQGILDATRMTAMNTGRQQVPVLG